MDENKQECKRSKTEFNYIKVIKMLKKKAKEYAQYQKKKWQVAVNDANARLADSTAVVRQCGDGVVQIPPKSLLSNKLAQQQNAKHLFILALYQY